MLWLVVFRVLQIHTLEDLLEITFAEDITKIVTATVGIAFAIAFGVGGIETAKKWWAKYLSPKETRGR